MKDRETGRHVSRPNRPEDWIVTGVPNLRVASDALWDQVKQPQGEIDTQPGVAAIRASRFWEKKRQVHLLTGLLRCGGG